MKKRLFAQAYLWLLLIILYAPICIIVIFSFTEAKVLGSWTGFSLNLYKNLFSGGVSNALFKSIENTLTIGILASLFSTALGTIAAIGIHNMRNREKRVITFFNDIPMLNPDIITGR